MTDPDMIIELSEHNKAVGARLGELRRSYGMTQAQAAENLGISQSNISLLESGKRGLSGMTALRFAILYETTLEDILGETAAKEVKPPEPGAAEAMLMGFLSDGSFTDVKGAVSSYLAAAAYRMLRAIYECNPHNSTELFSLDKAAAEKLTRKFLSDEPSKLSAVLSARPASVRSKLELPVEDAKALRTFIKSCEAMLSDSDT